MRSRRSQDFVCPAGADSRRSRTTRSFVANLEEGLGRTAIRKLHVPLRFTETDLAQAQASRFGYDLTVLVAPGRRRLAVAVRDDVAHVSSALGEEIEVAAGGASRAVVIRSGEPVSR
jgi:hypothetical protein